RTFVDGESIGGVRHQIGRRESSTILTVRKRVTRVADLDVARRAEERALVGPAVRTQVVGVEAALARGQIRALVVLVGEHHIAGAPGLTENLAEDDLI